jgi:Fe2+ or Zn2+ uptake regulation protein
MIQLSVRNNLILNILSTSEAEGGLTVSQIHDELYNNFLEEVSRKTVVRDLRYLENYNLIKKINSYPAKFKMKQKECVQIELNEDEIIYLNKVLKKNMRDLISQRIIKKLNE